jgi:hypothetical protein
MGITYKRARVYWIKYYRNCKLFRESQRAEWRLMLSLCLGSGGGNITGQAARDVL